jgi:hypothetical protein
LQVFFYTNKDALRTAGVYLSEAGRYESSPGNHNIAWDMLAEGDSKYFPELLSDLEKASCRIGLITSEDFSLLHARTDALRRLNDGLRSIGYRPIIVVYLRPQAAFAESMYSERIKHRYVRPLESYLGTILETGSYIPDGTKIHLVFEYSKLLEPFVHVFGKENVLVRAYVQGSDPLYIYKDFFNVFHAADPEFAKTPVKFRLQTGRANDSLNFLQLLHAAYSALHAEKAVASRDIANQLVAMVRCVEPRFPDELLASRFALITRPEVLQFLERFHGDNEAIAREYGARIPFATPDDVASEDDPRWQRADMQRLVFDRLLEGWIATA